MRSKRAHSIEAGKGRGGGTRITPPRVSAVPGCLTLALAPNAGVFHHQTGGFALAATLGQPRIATADSNAALALAAGVIVRRVYRLSPM